VECEGTSGRAGAGCQTRVPYPLARWSFPFFVLRRQTVSLSGSQVGKIVKTTVRTGDVHALIDLLQIGPVREAFDLMMLYTLLLVGLRVGYE
jgi:hypothetical protein